MTQSWLLTGTEKKYLTSNDRGIFPTQIATAKRIYYSPKSCIKLILNQDRNLERTTTWMIETVKVQWVYNEAWQIYCEITTLRIVTILLLRQPYTKDTQTIVTWHFCTFLGGSYSMRALLMMTKISLYLALEHETLLLIWGAFMP